MLSLYNQGERWPNGGLTVLRWRCIPTGSGATQVKNGTWNLHVEIRYHSCPRNDTLHVEISEIVESATLQKPLQADSMLPAPSAVSGERAVISSRRFSDPPALERLTNFGESAASCSSLHVEIVRGLLRDENDGRVTIAKARGGRGRFLFSGGPRVAVTRLLVFLVQI